MYVCGGVPLDAGVWLCAGAYTPLRTSRCALGMCTPRGVRSSRGGGGYPAASMSVCAGERAPRCAPACARERVRGAACLRVPGRPRARVPAAARPAGAPGAGAAASPPVAPSPPPRPAPQQDVEAAMRLPLAFAVLLLASARALAEEMGAPDDLSYWSDWSDGDQVKVSPGGRCSARGAAGAGRWVPGAAPGGRGAGGGRRGAGGGPR